MEGPAARHAGADGRPRTAIAFTAGRVGVEPAHPAVVLKVAAIVPESMSPHHVLGTATVHSETGRPISLTALPGTTRLLVGKTPCSKVQELQRLADGIMDHPLLVGSIGIFKPFDPCHGSEGTRFVDFDAVVR
jgi:hypothetical protein